MRVVLHAHPVVLGVAEEHEIVLELAADEPLVVVGGRVDEVADHLARRPLAGPGRAAGGLVGQREQARRGRIDGSAQALGIFRHRHRRPPFVSVTTAYSSSTIPDAL